MSAAEHPNANDKVPQWVWLTLGGLGSLLLVGGVVGWVLRGPAILIDMADFFCL